MGGVFVFMEINEMKLRDRDVRKILVDKINKIHKHEPDTLIVGELGLCQGISRIDVAVINGFMHGYEIKSEKDSLERLPAQIEVYSKIFDRVTMVTCENHRNKVIEMMPQWWGLAIVNPGKKNKLYIEEIRKNKDNPSVDAFAIAQLIWRDEAIDILKTLGLEKGMLSKSRKDLWHKLSMCVPIDQLKTYVRDKIKIRARWRSADTPT